MKSKWQVAFLFFWGTASMMVEAQEETQIFAEEGMLIDSAVADYDGRKITLSGDVVVEHDLGKISANFVELVPSREGKKLRFESLTLKENILIALKDGGKLSCAYAYLDYNGLIGNFKGDAEHEYVIYTEGYRDKDNMIIPLVVKSRQMNVKIDQQEDKSKTAKSRIASIDASDNVTVNYNHEFIAAADQASYQRLSAETNNLDYQNARVPGLIFLRAAEQNGLCQVTNRNSDLIRANNICIDTVKRHLLFSNPKGSISAGREGSQTERIDFSSDSMMWEALTDILTLQDHIVMNQPGLGRLTTEKELRFFRHTVAGIKQLRSIESPGPVVLNIIDEKKGIEHTLTGYGTFVINHQNLKTVMESPRTQNGEVLSNKQVCFQDNMGMIYADRLKIDYQVKDSDITPVKITLEGNVQILNRGELGQSKEGAFRQYALADVVEYSPQAKEVSLSANSGKRVLFLDKINGLEVSAPGLKLRRDQTTKKESIQGVGDVRFNFVETELQQMKKLFPGKSDE